MEAVDVFGSVTTRTHVIGNFDSFILNNIPYGLVVPSDVQWGNVRFDGPDVPGIDGAKPVLQWHFGGVAYPISCAIKVVYNYIRAWDGSNEIVKASLFIGFQGRLSQYIHALPIPFVQNPSATFTARVNNIGPFGAYSARVWASDAAILGSEAHSTVVHGAQYTDSPQDTFDRLLESQLGLSAARLDTILTTPTPVDFDGPAQDYDSHKIFKYTAESIALEPDLYDQLLFWYFGGKAYTLTKAIRIWLDTDYATGATQPSFVEAAALAPPPTGGSGGGATSGGSAPAAAPAAGTTTDIRARRAAPGGLHSSATGLTASNPSGHAIFIGFGGTSVGSGG